MRIFLSSVHLARIAIFTTNSEWEIVTGFAGRCRTGANLTTLRANNRATAGSVALTALGASALIVLAALPWLGALSHPSHRGSGLDSAFKIPDLIYHPTATVFLSWVQLAVGCGGLVIAGRASLKAKNWVPVMLALSAAAIAIPEVFVEVMGGCGYPASADNISFTILGRQMSWFIIPGWFGFAAPFMFACYALLKKGASERTIWLIVLLAGVTSVPIEEALLHFGVYYYYGNQPLILFAKYPFWWMPCNAGGIFLAAALAYRFDAQLQGWRSLCILLLTPMSVAGIYGFIAVPSWIVVNGNYSWLVTQAAGVLTLIMGCVAIALTIRLVVSRQVGETPSDSTA